MARGRVQGTFSVPSTLTARAAPSGRDRWRRVLLRAGAAAGIIGPAGFTAAWVTASLRQPGYSAAQIQISGLAARGARDRWIMVGGFLVLGGCLAAFGPALRQGLGGSRRAGPAPPMIEAAGVLVVAAGLLRTDHMLLIPGPESWHSQAHDAISAVNYTLLIAIPLLLARRLRGDPDWKGMPVLLVSAAVASAVILCVFSAATPDSLQAGILQRAGVTLPLAALVALATRLHRLRSS